MICFFLAPFSRRSLVGAALLGRFRAYAIRIPAAPNVQETRPSPSHCSSRAGLELVASMDLRCAHDSLLSAGTRKLQHVNIFSNNEHAAFVERLGPPPRKAYRPA